VNALSLERVEITRQCSDQRFAFAGDHFGNVARVQHHSAQELNIVMAHPQEAASAFSADGECFDQDVIERFAGLKPLAKLERLPPKLLIGQGRHLRLKRVDPVDFALKPANLTSVGRAE
jgi:hypothetical protein